MVVTTKGERMCGPARAKSVREAATRCALPYSAAWFLDNRDREVDEDVEVDGNDDDGGSDDDDEEVVWGMDGAWRGFEAEMTGNRWDDHDVLRKANDAANARWEGGERAR